MCIRDSIKEKLSITQLARQAGYTEYYFSHKFKNEIGYSAVSYTHLSWVKQYIHSIFEKMFHEIQEPVFGSSFRLCALCMELFWHLFDQNNYHNTPVKPGTEPERILFEQLSQFMKKTGRKVSRRQLEANFNYSGAVSYTHLLALNAMRIPIGCLFLG